MQRTVIRGGFIVTRDPALGNLPSGDVLIEDGVLCGYMQDRQNARLMGVDPTGNGRRQSYEHAPMPRPRTMPVAIRACTGSGVR